MEYKEKYNWLDDRCSVGGDSIQFGQWGCNKVTFLDGDRFQCPMCGKILKRKQHPFGTAGIIQIPQHLPLNFKREKS